MAKLVIRRTCRHVDLQISASDVGALADLAEADQVQGHVLEAVEQAVELGVITDRGGDAGAAPAALDDGVANQAC
jgi:hypothetical protein